MAYGAGQIFFASDVNAITGPWTDFSASFTITASTTSPTKGNSGYTAIYIQIGKTVHFAFRLKVGSTFTAGSGVYSFLLPVAASANAQISAAGAAWLLDSGTANRIALVTCSDATHVQISRDNAASPLDSGGPGTAWGTNDEIRCSITYEAA